MRKAVREIVKWVSILIPAKEQEILHSKHDEQWAESSWSRDRFFQLRNGSMCAMKSVPGRTTQNNRLSYLYRKGDVIMKTVSFRSNSTIKDHDAPECWVCAMKAVPGSKRFHQTCRWTASDPAHAHAMWFSSPFFPALSAISTLWERRQIFARRGNLGARTAEPLAATRNLRTARQSSRVHRRASLRGILSHRRVLRRCLHDACKTFHWSPCLVLQGAPPSYVEVMHVIN